MTADLVAFLNRALDEEAETARAATAGPWSWNRDCDRTRLQTRGGSWWYDSFDQAHHWDAAATVVESWGLEAHDVQVDSEDAAHIARQDPQATLDRVEATKATLAVHAGVHACCLGGMTARAFGQSDPCPTLRALATAYRRHPDYDKAWLPDGVGVDA